MSLNQPYILSTSLGIYLLRFYLLELIRKLPVSYTRLLYQLLLYSAVNILFDCVVRHLLIDYTSL